MFVDVRVLRVLRVLVYFFVSCSWMSGGSWGIWLDHDEKMQVILGLWIWSKTITLTKTWPAMAPMPHLPAMPQPSSLFSAVEVANRWTCHVRFPVLHCPRVSCRNHLVIPNFGLNFGHLPESMMNPDLLRPEPFRHSLKKCPTKWEKLEKLSKSVLNIPKLSFFLPLGWAPLDKPKRLEQQKCDHVRTFHLSTIARCQWLWSGKCREMFMFH